MIEPSWYTVPLLAARWKCTTEYIVNLIKCGDLAAYHRRRHGKVDEKTYFEVSTRVTEQINADGSVSSMGWGEDGMLTSKAGFHPNGELVIRCEDVEAAETERGSAQARQSDDFWERPANLRKPKRRVGYTAAVWKCFEGVIEKTGRPPTNGNLADSVWGVINDWVEHPEPKRVREAIRNMTVRE